MLPLDFILFLQIIIFMFITPGTPRIVIISYSMNYGVQKCVWTALGDVTANIIQFIILITTYVVLDFLSLVGYAILANKLIIWIKANPKIINTISACVIILIAIIIAFTQQY